MATKLSIDGVIFSGGKEISSWTLTPLAGGRCEGVRYTISAGARINVPHTGIRQRTYSSPLADNLWGPVSAWYEQGTNANGHPTVWLKRSYTQGTVWGPSNLKVTNIAQSYLGTLVEILWINIRPKDDEPEGGCGGGSSLVVTYADGTKSPALEFLQNPQDVFLVEDEICQNACNLANSIINKLG